MLRRRAPTGPATAAHVAGGSECTATQKADKVERARPLRAWPKGSEAAPQTSRDHCKIGAAAALHVGSSSRRSVLARFRPLAAGPATAKKSDCNRCISTLLAPRTSMPKSAPGKLPQMTIFLAFLLYAASFLSLRFLLPALANLPLLTEVRRRNHHLDRPAKKPMPR